ncbi:sensor histidine kinase [Microscilla marina]|uniref:histidine kinase n=1 Tax=Microscilla marina ATCC 23134 TaxID=313606 RepID=A1ZU15_MICM2|nr:HAMP domain-containing sensor histidine kinase [Microscilla marina]EAY26128.1 conserved hypothetical protein [Microscilla marina ATCC 23134]
MLFQQFVNKFNDEDFLRQFPRSFKYAFHIFTSITMLGASLWVSLSIAYGLYNVAIIPAGFMVTTLLSMWYLYASQNFKIVRFIQILTSMTLPFVYQWTLGGYMATGAVMLWSFIPLFGLLSFTHIERANYWIVWFILLLVASAFIDHQVQVRTPQILQSNINQKFFFTINAGIIGVITFFMIRAYIVVNIKRRKVNRLLKNQRSELIAKNHEIKQKNEAIRLQQAELSDLSHFKDKLLSIISHDLKSPLNTLQGTLTLLGAGAITPEELQVLTLELRDKMQATRYLMENILQWAMMQMEKVKFTPELLNLHDITADTLKVLTATQNKNIELYNDVPAETKVFADAHMVALVIRNLSANAIKFTQQDGEVRVTAQAMDKGYVEVAIQDNGVGIPPDVLPYLFDSTHTYTTEGTDDEKGTGLGLLLCQEFVEKNQGKIWAESTQGEGTTFKFTLPRKAPVLESQK